jgi:hypothetical protein
MSLMFLLGAVALTGPSQGAPAVQEKRVVTIQVTVIDVGEAKLNLVANRVQGQPTKTTFIGLQTGELLPFIKKSVSEGTARSILDSTMRSYDNEAANLSVDRGEASFKISMTPRIVNGNGEHVDLGYTLTLKPGHQGAGEWTDFHHLHLMPKETTGVYHRSVPLERGGGLVFMIFRAYVGSAE